jgi:hypothetical protein
MKNILNEFQVEQIANAVHNSSISSSYMKDDLIDHLCCIVEDKLSKGSGFEDAYQSALQWLTDSELCNVSNEKVFLFTSRARKNLLRTLYISGFLASVGAIATLSLKLLHLPFAQLVLLATSCVVILVIFPALYILIFKLPPNKNKPRKLLFNGALLLVLSAVFALSHWPGVFIMLLAAIACLYLAIFPRLFFIKFKK